MSRTHRVWSRGHAWRSALVRRYLSLRSCLRSCGQVLGTPLWPASYAVALADLHPVYEKNRMFKFADDTYLVVSAINTGTCQEEIDHLQTWTVENNLKLNWDKTEIVFTASRKRASPRPHPDIECVSSLRILDVIINNRLSATDHVTMLLLSCSSLGMSGLWAHRILRRIGHLAQNLQSRTELMIIYQMAQKMRTFCWFLLTLSLTTVKITQYTTHC